MGIIDTLSAGFSAVNKRLWVILIPVFLDLFLWLGPKLTAPELVNKTFDAYADVAAAAPPAADGQGEAIAQMAQLGEQLRGLNFFNFIAWQPPSLMGAQLIDVPAGLFNAPVLGVENGFILLGLIFGLGLLSLLIQSAFLSALAEVIRPDESSLRFSIGRIGLNWARLVAYCLVVPLLAFLLAAPILIAGGLIGLISPALGNFVMGLLVALGVWLALYLFFSVAAMFVANVGPVLGIWYSFSIIRRYFWSSLGLVVLILVIRFGLLRIWGLALGDPTGVLAAILGNAYIDTGLAAASLIYFRDRYTKWQAELEHFRELVQKA